MSRSLWVRSWVLIFFGLVSSHLAASDLAREQRWAEQIGDAIMTGDVEYLKAGDHTFMAIVTEAATDAPKGAVIVMHGLGVHPDWPDVVHPLRTQLPDAGWTTLSVQLPVLAADAQGTDYIAILPEVVPRMDAALAYLQAAGYERIAVVAHSLGALMATHWLAGNGDSGIGGIAAIGASATKAPDGTGVVTHLQQIRIPVMDLFGSDDLPAVIEEAQLRAAAAEQSGGVFRQNVVPGANHFFQGKEVDLVHVVGEWLDGLP